MLVVVHDMELVCVRPTWNSPEQAFLKREMLCTQIMVLLSSLQKVSVPTLHPQLTSVFLSEIIKLFVYLVSKFLVSDVRCRNKASIELCILENRHEPCHEFLGMFELLEGGVIPKATVDYQSVPQYNWLVQTSYLAYKMSDLLHLPCPPCPRPHPLYQSMIWHILLESCNRKIIEITE